MATGHHFTKLRYEVRHLKYAGTNSQFAKFIDKFPNLAAVGMNSTIDLLRATLENNWGNFNRNLWKDNLIKGVTPWGYEYSGPKGQVIALPGINLHSDFE